jgi:hypothetical protein
VHHDFPQFMDGQGIPLAAGGIRLGFGVEREPRRQNEEDAKCATDGSGAEVVPHGA